MVHGSALLIAITVMMGWDFVGPAFVEAQPSTPFPHLPAAPAPLNLGTVRLPADAQEVTALFAQLPATVNGQPRSDDPEQQIDRVHATYGAVDPDFGRPLTLGAENLATGDFEFGVGFTVADFAAIAADPAYDYDAVAFGQDGSLVWVEAETTVAVEGNQQRTPTTIRVFYTLAWGDAATSWLFTAAAFYPEGLDALVRAVVATAELRPATPITESLPAAATCPSTRCCGLTRVQGQPARDLPEVLRACERLRSLQVRGKKRLPLIGCHLRHERDQPPTTELTMLA